MVKNLKQNIITQINELKEGVFQLDLKGNVILNNKLSEFNGQSIFDLLTREVDESGDNYLNKMLWGITKTDKAKLLADFEIVLNEKSNKNGVVAFINNKNETRLKTYLLWYSSTEIGDDTIIVTFTDITVKQNQEEYLMENIQKDKDFNVLKSKLVSIASHQLRTPLSVILTSAEISNLILADSKKDATTEVKNYLTNIVDEVIRLTGMLNEISNICHIDLEKYDLSPKLVPSNYFIETVTAAFKPHHDGRSLETCIDQNMGDFLIDSELLKHGLINLLNIIFNYTEKTSTPSLAVSLQNNQIHFTIKGFEILSDQKDNLIGKYNCVCNKVNISGNENGFELLKFAVKSHHGTMGFIQETGTTSFEVVIPMISE